MSEWKNWKSGDKLNIVNVIPDTHPFSYGESVTLIYHDTNRNKHAPYCVNEDGVDGWVFIENLMPIIPPVGAVPSKWQPIETAPMDGTEIVATDGDLTETTIYSCRSWVYGCCGLNWNPTHWMPLPEPPK